MTQQEDYEKQILDVDELAGTDVKINPDYYIHNAIVKAQQALTNADVRTGFLQFRILVENVETLAQAAGMIPNDYETQLQEFKLSEEYTKEDATIQSVKLANTKLRIILSQVFSTKTTTAPLKA